MMADTPAGSEKPSPAGKVDLHSHLLPGIDDGCQSVAESLECIHLLIAAGYVGTVCTPHMVCEDYPENTPARVREWIAALRETLIREGIEYSLWPGGELRLDLDTVEWMERHGVPTLADGRHVLIDYWGTSWPEHADITIDYLLQKDFVPVLAHPERLRLDDADFDALLARLRGIGVRLQGNLRPLTGEEGPTPAARAWQLLNAGAYDVLALDMHGPETLASRIAGIGRVEQGLGDRFVQLYLEQRPRQFLQPSTEFREGGT